MIYNSFDLLRILKRNMFDKRVNILILPILDESFADFALNFVDALYLCFPRIVRALIARSAWVKFNIIRELQHDWPHHFVIFVEKNVAVVHKSGVFSQLINWNMEVFRVVAAVFVAGPCPPHPKHSDIKSFNIGCIFPLFVEWSLGLHFTCDIFLTILICREQ